MFFLLPRKSALILLPRKSALRLNGFRREFQTCGPLAVRTYAL